MHVTQHGRLLCGYADPLLGCGTTKVMIALHCVLPHNVPRQSYAPEHLQEYPASLCSLSLAVTQKHCVQVPVLSSAELSIPRKCPRTAMVHSKCRVAQREAVAVQLPGGRKSPCHQMYAGKRWFPCREGAKRAVGCAGNTLQ